MRLIDADSLMEELSKWLKEVDPAHPSENYALLPMEEDIIVSTLMTIEEQPTIEAVPVIRCKDCRYMRIERTEGSLSPTYWCYCEQTNCDTDSWGYCHRAERRTLEGAEDDA